MPVVITWRKTFYFLVVLLFLHSVAVVADDQKVYEVVIHQQLQLDPAIENQIEHTVEITGDVSGAFDYQRLAPTNSVAPQYMKQSTNAFFRGQIALHQLPTDSPQKRTPWNQMAQLTLQGGTINFNPGYGGALSFGVDSDFDVLPKDLDHSVIRGFVRLHTDNGNTESFDTVGVRQAVYTIQGGIALKEASDGSIVGRLSVGPAGFVDTNDVAQPIIQAGGEVHFEEQAFLNSYLAASIALDAAYFYYGEHTEQAEAAVRVGTDRNSPSHFSFYLQPQINFGNNFAVSTHGMDWVRGFTVFLNAGVTFNQ